MSDPRRRRLDAATGLVFVLLMTVALFLPGPPPKAEDSVDLITAMLVRERDAFLVGGYVAGLAAMAYLWFLGSVRDYLDRHGADEPEPAAAVAGGVFAIALMLTGITTIGGVAFAAARLGDPALVRAANDTGTFLIETSKFGFAVFVLAVSRAGMARNGAARGILPGWLIGLGAVSVVLMVASAAALFRDHGIFQFGGVIDVAGSAPGLLWIAALSLVMTRSAP